LDNVEWKDVGNISLSALGSNFKGFVREFAVLWEN
jgi:hypothetical protein